MSDYFRMIAFWGILLLSVLSLLAPLFIYRRYRKRSSQLCDELEVRLRFYTIGYIVGLFLMQFAIGIATMRLNLEDAEELNAVEHFVQSAFLSLKSLSADPEYETSIGNVKEIITQLFGWPEWAGIPIRLYVTFMTFIAPVVGGAWLFNVLLKYFPGFRLWYLCRQRKYMIYYFSELNERSLPLARSVLERDRQRRAAEEKEREEKKKAEKQSAKAQRAERKAAGVKLSSQEKEKLAEEKKRKKEEEKKELEARIEGSAVVFTDAYLDDESESSSELMEEAKRIGAICVRDDLLHVRINGQGHRNFFLIDMKEVGNLQTMTDLASEEKSEVLQKSEVYLFSQDDICAHVKDQVKEQLTAQYRQRALETLKAQTEGWDQMSEEDRTKLIDEKASDKAIEALLPTIIPVQSFRNLISNLLVEVPLFEPLIRPNGENKRELKVTVLGTGAIGKEAFLTVYWLGQLLDTKLHIHVVSRHEEKAFTGFLDYLNPDIRASMQKDSPLLRLNGNGKFAAPYATMSYTQTEIRSEIFEAMLVDPTRPDTLLNTDYFIVALGTDEDNLSVSEHIRTRMAAYHLSQAEPTNTVISYVLFDGELCNAMKEEKADVSNHVYMHPFGSLNEAFSAENIFMDAHMEAAEELDASYRQIQNDQMKLEKIKSDYDLWSNLANKLHMKYKAYSVGLIRSSVFAPSQTRCAVTNRDIIRYFDTHPSDEHRIAWLEHRRWNAFMRIKGFRGTAHWAKYYDRKSSHKEMNLQLHPCLVECDERGMRDEATMRAAEAYLFEDPTSPIGFSLPQDIPGELDLLDALTVAVRARKKPRQGDFKYYDYPEFQFSARHRFLFASDIHLCHIDWYGVPTEERMERFVRHVREEYEKDPFEALFLLGDYSLDHWKWNIKGSWLTEGKSNTRRFAEQYVSRLKELGIPVVMIAGNHEQYGEALWTEMTGHHRRDHLPAGSLLFIFCDTFGADLDPTEHSDGTYCGADVDFIRGLMAQYPQKKVVLCAHHFAPERESEAFRTLVREDERILCLFGGHVHRSSVVELGEDWGGKVLLYTGNYSYNSGKEADAESSLWGFRDLIFDGNGFSSRYITPENDVVLDGRSVHHAAGEQDVYPPVKK